MTHKLAIDIVSYLESELRKDHNIDVLKLSSKLSDEFKLSPTESVKIIEDIIRVFNSEFLVNLLFK